MDLPQWFSSYAFTLQIKAVGRIKIAVEAFGGSSCSGLIKHILTNQWLCQCLTTLVPPGFILKVDTQLKKHN